ncbi:hypothetical protein [Arsenicitalea aurantiaca]|nr:hypothetical protein [Arsenicitalea aurantiaca]
MLPLIMIVLLLAGFAARPAVANAIFACDAPLIETAMVLETAAADEAPASPGLFGQACHIIGVMPASLVLLPDGRHVRPEGHALAEGLAHPPHAPRRPPRG